MTSPDWIQLGITVLGIAFMAGIYWKGVASRNASTTHAVAELKTEIGEVRAEQRETHSLVVELRTKLIGIKGDNGTLSDLWREISRLRDSRHEVDTDLTEHKFRLAEYERRLVFLEQRQGGESA